MATRNPASEEEFASQQTAFGSQPAFVLQEVSLTDMVATPGAPPESLLGERIRYARSDLRLSIEALSRLTKEYDQPEGGLSPTSISRYESGESLPGLREFRLIAESLDVPVGWLLYGTIEEKRPEFSHEERQVLHALRSFVAASKDDANIVDNPQRDWFKAEVRMGKLNRARKPTQK